MHSKEVKFHLRLTKNVSSMKDISSLSYTKNCELPNSLMIRKKMMLFSMIELFITKVKLRSLPSKMFEVC